MFRVTRPSIHGGHDGPRLLDQPAQLAAAVAVGDASASTASAPSSPTVCGSASIAVNVHAV